MKKIIIFIFRLVFFTGCFESNNAKTTSEIFINKFYNNDYHNMSNLLTKESFEYLIDKMTLPCYIDNIKSDKITKELSKEYVDYSFQLPKSSKIKFYSYSIFEKELKVCNDIIGYKIRNVDFINTLKEETNENKKSFSFEYSIKNSKNTNNIELNLIENNNNWKIDLSKKDLNSLLLYWTN